MVAKYKKLSTTRDNEPSVAARANGTATVIDGEQTVVDGTERTQSNERGNDLTSSSSSVVIVDMEDDDTNDADVSEDILEKSENAAAAMR
jgi:hypothetical protein